MTSISEHLIHRCLKCFTVSVCSFRIPMAGSTFIGLIIVAAHNLVDVEWQQRDSIGVALAEPQVTSVKLFSSAI